MNSPKHLMKSHMGWVMLLCLAVGGTACAPPTEQAAPGPVVNTAADMAAINSVHDEHTAALNAGDAASYVALLTEDAVLLPPNQPAVLGRDAIRDYRQTMFEQNTLDVTRSSEKAVVTGDWAYVSHNYRGTLTPTAGGEPSEISGKGITIFQRQPNGSWKISRYLWSSDTPPPGTGQ